MTGARRGVSAIESVVALWIFVLLCLLAGAVVGAARRRAAAVAGATHAAAVLRHGAAAIATDLRARASGDWIAVDDSTIDMLAHVGAAVACGNHPAGGFVVPAAAVGEEPPLTTLRRLPQPGDVMQLLAPGPAGDGWTSHEVATVEAAPGIACSVGLSSFTARPPLRIVAHPAPAHPPAAGTPLRVLARVRYSIYKDGTGRWQLGLRRCGAAPGSPCVGLQPVAGPMGPGSANPAVRGLRVEPLAADGSPLADATSAAAFRLTLRAPRAAARHWNPTGATPGADSLVVIVATRNRP